ncbi:immunoglobulin J chain [Thamnophis elegans]|uniref:immunoglobulin J chain n=1 Tax=Thamnophis elegans TaxID=35005 RepID=UPI001376F7AF|nr:immunoglobulin J chain [Thamnophis elegans]
MKTSWIFRGIGIIFCSIVLVTAYWQEEEDEEKVLVDNKCQCVKVTSKFVPDKDNPQEEILERNIRIIVPLNARENISDPTSPVRTRFVYKIPKLCDKCNDPSRTANGVTFGSSTLCGHPQEPCYTYDRNKCYTASALFSHNGVTSTVETSLTPEACYPD